MGFCGGQNKNHIGGRFFQRFQQCIECPCGKHMNLINNIDFISAFRGRISHFLADFPDVIHTVVGCGVNLYHIHGAACANGPAGGALAAGASFPRMIAVDCPGKYFGYGSLPGSSGSAEQIGMSHPFCPDLIFQGCYNMFLSPDIFKFLRTEFPV